MIFILQLLLVLLAFLGIYRAEPINSLNYYGDNTYPGRCVIDMGNSLVLLKLMESVQLESLPCTSIFCIGDGYGMLSTCSHDKPPDDCRYSKFDWDAEFPNCCDRRVICD